MYESFYGFSEKPFSLFPDPSFLYLGKTHRAAYAMLEYGLMNQAGFTAITGDVGSGKTTLVRHLLKKISDGITVGLINNTPKNIGQVLQWVLLAFDQDYREENQVVLYDTFRRFLNDQNEQNKRTVLIIDEAQNLQPDVLEELRMLSNINADKYQVLQMILVGQPGLLTLLKNPELLQFRQRIGSVYSIKPLDRDETGRYILHRTSCAGVERAVFLEGAIDLVYEASKGVPRVINVLCDTALVYGFSEELEQVDEELVHSVLTDKVNTGLFEMETSGDADQKPDKDETPVCTPAYERNGKDLKSFPEIDQGILKYLLEYCNNDPTIDRRTLVELIAEVQAEYIDAKAAKAVLEDYPGRYKALFEDAAVGQKQCLRTLERHMGWVNCVALMLNGLRVLLGSDDKKLRLWSIETGQSLQLPTGQRGYAQFATTKPNGRQALSGNQDKTVQIWELPLYKRYRPSFWTDPRPTEMVKQEAKVPQHEPTTRLEGTSSGERDHREISRQRVKLPVLESTTEPEGSWDTKGSPQTIRKKEVSIKQYESLAEPEGPMDDVGNADAWVALREVWKRSDYPEDRSFFRSYHQLLSEGRQTTLLMVKMLRRLNGNTDGVFAVAQSQDGQRGLSGSADTTLRLWDLDTGECLHTLQGHTDRVSSVALSPDGRLGLSGSADTTLRLWDLDTGECLRILEGNTNPFMSVDFTPDGHWALTGQCFGFVDDSTLLSLWDLETGKLVRTWEGHPGQVRSVAMTPNGHWGLSGCADNNLRLWNLKTGENIHTLEGHTNAVNSVALTQDGRWGLSGSQDTNLRLWDLETGECLYQLEGHTGGVRAVAMTPDGRWALSGSFDNTLRLWNLETGECLHTMKQHTEYVTSVSLSVDGCQGLSGSVDNTLLQWRFVWDLEFPDNNPSNNSSEVLLQTDAL